MISLKELSAYFKKLAIQHKDIAHTDTKPRFFRLKNSELGTSLGKADDFILLLETPEFNYSDNNADNFMKDKTAAFSILKRCKQSDFDQIDDIVDDCETISHEIIKAIKRDNDNYGEQLFGNFPINSISGFKVGPVFDGFYGIRTEFKYGDFISMCIDDAKWDLNLGN